MKTLATALMLSLGLLSAGAQAAPNAEPNNLPYQGVYSQTDANAPTRAQVQAELAQAKANGQYTFGELEYPATQTGSTAAPSRDQVRQNWPRPRPAANTPSANSTTRPATEHRPAHPRPAFACQSNCAIPTRDGGSSFTDGEAAMDATPRATRRVARKAGEGAGQPVDSKELIIAINGCQ